MKNSKLLFSILISTLMIGLYSCDSNNENDDPSGIARYYIQNISDYDLSVEFIKSDNLGGGLDDTKLIEANKTVKIFEDNILNENPKPSDSFASVKLKTTIDNTVLTVYTQEPINDDNWPITAQDLGDDRVGVTKYHLVISNQDLIF